MKRTLIRVSALVLLLLISMALYYSGKGHTLLLDNKNIEIDDTSYKALDFAEVTIDSGEEQEILKRDRLKQDVSGQKHRITVVYLESGEEQTIQKTFKIDVGEPIYIISIPALIADHEKWIQVFEPLN